MKIDKRSRCWRRIYESEEKEMYRNLEHSIAMFIN